MTDKRRPSSPRSKRLPRNDECERIVRAIAFDTSRVKLTTHARDRMRERGITYDDVLYILESGYAVAAEWENGRLKVKLVRRLALNREAGVVTLVLNETGDAGTLIVKTVEWEDL